MSTLNKTQYDILVALRGAGPMTPEDLSRAAGKSRRQIQNAAGPLIERALAKEDTSRSGELRYTITAKGIRETYRDAPASRKPAPEPEPSESREPEEQPEELNPESNDAGTDE